MTTLFRASACAALLFGAALLVVGVLVPYLGGTSPFADLGTLCREFWEQKRREDALDIRAQSWREVLRAKREATGELLAGRLTLAEAIQRFDEIDAILNDGQDEILGSAHNSGARGETQSDAVLRWARDHAAEGSFAPAALERIQAEAAEYQQ